MVDEVRKFRRRRPRPFALSPNTAQALPSQPIGAPCSPPAKENKSGSHNEQFIWVPAHVVQTASNRTYGSYGSHPRHDWNFDARPTARQARSFRHPKGDDIGPLISPGTANRRDSHEWGWIHARVEKTATPQPNRSNGRKHGPAQTTFITVEDAESSCNGHHLALSCDEMGETLFDNEDYMHPPDDLALLAHLHEPSVVHALRLRYAHNVVYTRTGPILLAVNPFCSVQGLYGEDIMERYRHSFASKQFNAPCRNRPPDAKKSARKDALPPHVYAVAHEAFSAMKSDSHNDHTLSNQSILVSGESGAGKTVTTRIVMGYLASLHRSTNKTSHAGGVDRRIMRSNPILESFGNARTVRNDNSSRFGRWMELRFGSSKFNKDLRLMGAGVETYLLEKVRLVKQSPGERNYHAFYELLASNVNDCPNGAPRTPRDPYGLFGKTSADFSMTNSSPETLGRRDGVKDGDSYAELVQAMKAIGFDEQERDNVFSLVAALLHLSNITFHGDEERSTLCLDTNGDALTLALELFGVTATALQQALCTCTLEARGETLQKVLGVTRAKEALEALIKATYAALFAYIVKRVNESISSDGCIDSTVVDATTPSAVIGVLDIFGFESFQKNSFEQLCINYCNEALQQQFNRFVFKLEKAEYEREGVDWSDVCFPDNQDVLDLIESKRSGILGVLDEQCRLAQCNDVTFIHAVYDVCGDHHRFKADKSQRASGFFVIDHYAGPVEYDSEVFLVKNRDELPKETTELLMSSTRSFVVGLGEVLRCPNPIPNMNNRRNRMQRSSSSLVRPTVGTQFASQLRDLRDKIEQTTPHYIRCLKPNDELVPHKFVAAMVAEQLRCAGVIEAVRVSRVGFPQRFIRDAFWDRYRVLAIREMRIGRNRSQNFDQFHALIEVVVPRILEWMSNNGNGDPTSNATQRNGIQKNLVASAGIHMGHTKVFLRRQAYDALESLRTSSLDASAATIQCKYRSFTQRQIFLYILKSCLALQCAIRRWIAIALVEQRRRHYAACVLQRMWRGFIARHEFLGAMYVAVWSQCFWRGWVGRKTCQQMKEERKALLIQSHWKMMRQYSIYQRQKRLSLNLQLLIRAKIARKVIRDLRRNAKDLNRIVAERDELRKEAQRMRQQLDEVKASSLHTGKESTVIIQEEEEEIRQLRDVCAEKDRELEHLRRELDAMRMERRSESGFVSIRNLFARRSKPLSPYETTVTTTDETSTASSVTNEDQVAPALEKAKKGPFSLIPGLDNLLRRSGSFASDGAAWRSPRSARSLHSPQNGAKSTVECVGSGQANMLTLERYLGDALIPAVRNELASVVVHPTPFHSAVETSDEHALSEAVGNSLALDTDINKGDKNGLTPLHLAAESADVHMLRLLLQNNAVANAQDYEGNTPLHYAKNCHAASLLLEVGHANPNIPNYRGVCALHLAVARRDVDSVQALLSFGASADVADNESWFTPLHIVAHVNEDDMADGIFVSSSLTTFQTDSIMVASLLCQASSRCVPDLNAQDIDGNTPLHHAAILHERIVYEFLSLFLRHSANPNVRNERGQTPMHLLLHNKKLRSFRFYQELVSLFLRSGGDPNQASLNGCTCLHLALYHCDIESAVKLLHHGAQLHLPWKKPARWDVHWEDTGDEYVLCLDMVQNEDAIYHLFSAIRVQQKQPPLRKSCMFCKTPFGPLFGRQFHCQHCGTLVCGKCAPSRLDQAKMNHSDRTILQNNCSRVCWYCEDILSARKAFEKTEESQRDNEM